MEHPLKTFICYAHEDRQVVDDLREHLTLYEKKKILEVWYDGKILAGEKWDDSIKNALKAADLVLMFISVKFINSEYIEKTELQEALTRHRAGEATLIPIIVSSCDWGEYFEIGQFQALPNQAKPILSHHFPHKADAYHEVAVGIKQTAQNMGEKKRALREKAEAEKVLLEQQRAAEAEKNEKARHRRDEATWKKVLAEAEKADDPEHKIISFEAYLADAKYLNHREEAEEKIADIAANYLLFQNLFQNGHLRNISAMQQCMETLEMHFETIKLKMVCKIAALKSLRPSKSETQSETESLGTAQSEDIKNPTLLKWYDLILQLIETQSEEYYNQLEEMLTQYAYQLDPGELHGIIIYMQNYAAQQIRTGKEVVFGKKLHLLNQISVENGVFSQVEVMSLTQFTNIVNTACSVKDYKWAVSFVNDQNHLLPDEVRLFTVTLSNAIILFDQKKYREVIDSLKTTDINHIHYSLRSRALVLRSHYELGSDIDDVLNYCIAFEGFLRRNRKPETGAVEAMLGFLMVFKMLLLRKVEKQVILDKIEKTPSLYFKNWLLEKAEIYRKW